ncbi:type IVB secretion system protein IcmH/DotU [Pseudomonas sp. R5(2019)]|uniref:type IVB secretion system protein IcmH/DotU n=1 Tax=Pseudomonas sp. R5(2019) TaxID=2697566 RepID=UPI001412F7CC|nr:type IVB secretion system protein IcmH/DotU [Pseudomonas sp. R5(2019)]NBA94146.1 DotU family type IV/VI secretion system protein [Pseudomonas sp. R5(2019)]
MNTSVLVGNDRVESKTPTGTSLDMPNDFVRTAPQTSIDDVLFDGASGIDTDEDLQFRLRGHSLNPLVDAAQPLFGLVIRLRRLGKLSETDITQLYERVRDHITALSEEVRQLGYDGATQLSYRYALCAFIDEAVMATTWGVNSRWRERSLLSYHHNETWGGEKFFTVLARMQMDAAKYRDVLEFKYLCLCLGFQGKYGQQHNHKDTLNAIIGKLHKTLRSLRGDAPERLTDAPDNVVTRSYHLGRQWPLWTPWAFALVIVASAYTYFAMKLGTTTQLVLESLESILKL